MPEMGESVTEGTVLEWHVTEGDQVAEGDTVVEVSTDKVDAEVPAPASGTITKILVGPDETVEVGKPLAEMTAGRGAARATARGDADGTRGGRAEAAAAVGDGDGADATPVARRAAAGQRGRPERASRAAAPGGKVTKADVLCGRAATAPRRRAAVDRGRGEAAARPRGDARQGDEREPLDPDRDLVPRRSPSTRSTPSARRSTRSSRSAG